MLSNLFKLVLICLVFSVIIRLSQLSEKIQSMEECVGDFITVHDAKLLAKEMKIILKSEVN